MLKPDPAQRPIRILANTFFLAVGGVVAHVLSRYHRAEITSD